MVTICGILVYFHIFVFNIQLIESSISILRSIFGINISLRVIKPFKLGYFQFSLFLPSTQTAYLAYIKENCLKSLSSACVENITFPEFIFVIRLKCLGWPFHYAYTGFTEWSKYCITGTVELLKTSILPIEEIWRIYLVIFWILQ